MAGAWKQIAPWQRSRADCVETRGSQPTRWEQEKNFVLSELSNVMKRRRSVLSGQMRRARHRGPDSFGQGTNVTCELTLLSIVSAGIFLGKYRNVNNSRFKMLWKAAVGVSCRPRCSSSGRRRRGLTILSLLIEDSLKSTTRAVRVCAFNRRCARVHTERILRSIPELGFYPVQYQLSNLPVA